MVIFIEDKQPLFEIVQAAGKREYNNLLVQMKQNPKLYQMLNTPINEIPKYQFLTDTPFLKNATVMQIIKVTMEFPAVESYFVKTPKGLYIGFIAINIIIEDGKQVVNDVKTFSFGLDNEADENQMYKDLPAFLDKCLTKYGKVSWMAIVGNKANRAYEIYTKRHKGIISKNGKYIRYTCVK